MQFFVLSHNLQIHSESVPSFTPSELAEGLSLHSDHINTNALNHPHWMVLVESDLSHQELAREVVNAWKKFRNSLGHSMNHSFIALGGRKDSEATPGSPLQEGYWGVDVVECANPDSFLKSINWDALKASRPVDGVFEVRD
ncbi:hypothetical protein WB44_13670 [Synechococcus sp. WH 8020]|uniref:DUF2656 family protein n=1 Tax=unclassified Synechococcus TaxID=2626047 RepID=UPI00065284C0|nr:DUF2656 family protein [Synechococcus sp. WH 8020]AKN61972.1 hypothetical protein WB44_13670 [Synechococcus sp. WH 8020]